MDIFRPPSLILGIYVLIAPGVTMALLVGGVIMAYACYDRFGFNRSDFIGYPVVLALSVVSITVSLRAWYRFVIRGQGESETPLLTRAVPFSLVAGAAFGAWAGTSINANRDSYAQYFAKRHCAELLCPPEIEGGHVNEDDCDAPRFETCLPIALRCQKDRRGVTFEKRFAAERECVGNALGR
ncbi:MAG: hypothetical protein AAF605_00880 [Myxococcota bacterium]